MTGPTANGFRAIPATLAAVGALTALTSAQLPTAGSAPQIFYFDTLGYTETWINLIPLDITVPPEALFTLASARRITGNAFGMEFELAPSQVDALAAFVARVFGDAAR